MYMLHSQSRIVPNPKRIGSLVLQHPSSYYTNQKLPSNSSSQGCHSSVNDWNGLCDCDLLCENPPRSHILQIPDTCINFQLLDNLSNNMQIFVVLQQTVPEL